MHSADASQIFFGSKVALKNFRDNKYIKVMHQEQSVTCTGSHPTLCYEGREKSEELIIQNPTNREYKGNVTFGSAVSFLTNSGSLLVFRKDGSVGIEDVDSEMSKLARWTILDANSTSSRRAVTCYDEITLKSAFGDLFTDSDSRVYANANETSAESTWKIMRANIPFMPDWTFTRPHLDKNDLVLGRSMMADQHSKMPVRRRTYPDESKNLGNLPFHTQETMLIEDLLFCLVSIEGTYIKRKQESSTGTTRKFIYAVEPYLDMPTCDESLLFLVSKILPICTHYDRIRIFLNVHGHFDFGMVNHALCEALNSLLKEYILRITQLDSEYAKGDMTLQKLWYYVQPSLRNLDTIYKFIVEAENMKGGALLNVIYRCMVSASDPNSRQIMTFLMEKASIPYMGMLNNWIHYGIIKDPYEEFLIRERKECTKENLKQDFNDNYWEQRFVFREAQVPQFLQKLTAKVLFTGKYLNVIRECGKVVDCPFADELDPKKNPKLLSGANSQRDFFEPIERAYEWAAKKLLELIIVEESLVERLKSMKHYFFLDRGDFFVHFVDIAEEELEKQHKNVSIEKLESLLEMACRTSSANYDQFKDDLSCELQDYTLLEQLYAMHNITGTAQNLLEREDHYFSTGQKFKGLETFVLDYKVAWPLTLIISRKQLIMYQIIFRHLFYCKYVERQLSNTWLDHQCTKELDIQSTFAGSYVLIQRMLHFVKNYVYYMAVEVLEQQWLKFQTNLSKVTTIDDIMRYHEQYLNECMNESLLMDQELYKHLNQTVSSCLFFSEQVMNYTRTMRAEKASHRMSANETRSLRIQEESQAIKSMLKEQRYTHIIHKYAREFDEGIIAFLKTININRGMTESHLLNLVNRLDFNNFYSEQLHRV